MTTPPSPLPPPASRVSNPVLDDREKMVLVPLDNVLKTTDETYLTPALRQAFEQEFAAYLGKPQYPLLVANQVTDWLCTHVLGQYPVAVARRQLGASYLHSFRNTILGRVMLAALPLMGPERTLRRSPQDFSRALNYGTRWTAELGPRHWRYDFEDELFYPEWLEGFLTASFLDLLQVPNFRITFTLPAPRHISFDLRWD